MLQQHVHISLIDWISDAFSQGYTNLQSLNKCLDHRGVASNTWQERLERL